MVGFTLDVDKKQVIFSYEQWEHFLTEVGIDHYHVMPKESRPTKYAPDVAPITSAEPDSGLESVPAVESDTQPRG